MCIFTHSEDKLESIDALGHFPSFKNHAAVKKLRRQDIVVPQEELIKGLCPNVELSVYFPGFPTLQHLEHTGVLEKAKVCDDWKRYVETRTKRY